MLIIFTHALIPIALERHIRNNPAIMKTLYLLYSLILPLFFLKESQ